MSKLKTGCPKWHLDTNLANALHLKPTESTNRSLIQLMVQPKIEFTLVLSPLLHLTCGIGKVDDKDLAVSSNHCNSWLLYTHHSVQGQTVLIVLNTERSTQVFKNALMRIWSLMWNSTIYMPGSWKSQKVVPNSTIILLILTLKGYGSLNYMMSIFILSLEVLCTQCCQA